MLGTTPPLPEAPRTRPILNSQAERGGARVSLPLDHQAASIVSLAAPLFAGRRGKCDHGSLRAHYSAQVSDRCDSGHNKIHNFQKESKNLFLFTISVLPVGSQSAQPFQPLATWAEAWQAGHPRYVNVGNDYGKTRLYTPIRSKTTALPRCTRHHSAQRECSSPPRRGDESTGKRSHRNRSSSPERVRL